MCTLPTCWSRLSRTGVIGAGGVRVGLILPILDRCQSGQGLLAELARIDPAPVMTDQHGEVSMAHLPLEPVDWGSLLKHEGRVCMPRLHERPIWNFGLLDQPWPQRLRHPVHVQCLPRPIRENEFAPQFHPVSFLQQFLAAAGQPLDVTETRLPLPPPFSMARQTPSHHPPSPAHYAPA